jgi:hypothetical protein
MWPMALTLLLHVVLDCQLQNGGMSRSYSFVCYSMGTENSKSTELHTLWTSENLIAR